MPRMKDGIPLRVKASASVTRGSIWHGAVPVQRLQRLAAVLAGPAGELQVELQAGRNIAGHGVLGGKITGELPLACQNCMKTFSWPLETTLDLRLVHSEAEEKRLLNECEPLLVEDDTLQLQALVEEEALLALPIAPRCPECGGG